jgi:hypothetical protein
VQENIDSFPTSQETFCDVYCPQSDTAELDKVSAFENIIDITLVQLIVDETNRYAQQKISDLSHFAPGFGSGKMLQWTKCTGFGTICVDWHYTKAYTLILLHKEPPAVHSIFFRDFTSGKTRGNNEMYAFFR